MIGNPLTGDVVSQGLVAGQGDHPALVVRPIPRDVDRLARDMDRAFMKLPDTEINGRRYRGVPAMVHGAAGQACSECEPVRGKLDHGPGDDDLLL
jgi:hypothetical protein